MPKVRASSGTIGTIVLADVLVPHQRVQHAHERHRGGDLALAGALSWLSNAASGGTSSGADFGRAPAGSRPAPARRSLQVPHLRAVLGGLAGTAASAICSSVIGMSKRSRNSAQRILGHLLLLVRDVLALAGLAHAVALDRLGQDHRRLPAVLARPPRRRHRPSRVVAAAVQRPDLVVGHVGDHVHQLRVLAEEMLAHVGAVLGLEVLVLAVDAFLHPLEQQSRWCRARAAGPSRCPRSP